MAAIPAAARVCHLSAGRRHGAKLHRWRGAAGRKSTPGPPMTLGNAATARVRLVVWCKGCQHKGRAGPDGPRQPGCGVPYCRRTALAYIGRVHRRA